MKFLIVGAVKNCETNLQETINCLDKAFNFAKKIEYFFVESDSDDNTLTSLKKLKQSKSNLEFISLGNLSKDIPIRVERIAFCRNKYIEYLWTEQNKWVDYLVVVDMDGVCTELTTEAVKSCWNKKSWAACTANQSDYYYDIWALRHHTWCPYDFGLAYRENKKLGFDKSYLDLNLYSKMINIPASFDFIKVNSAFGGLAIYDKSQIPTNARYSARDKNNDIICDHPTFNEFITKSGGEIYINPKLIIGKIPEKFHSWINYKKFITKIFWLTKGLNSFLNKNFIGKLIKKLFTKISNSF